MSPNQPKSKREERHEARKEHEKDWVAPAGSPKETQYLRQLLQHSDLTPEERHEIVQILTRDDRAHARHDLLWHSAKKALLGPMGYDTAIKRHERLDDKTFLVACFTAQGIKEKDIAELLNLSKRMVDNIIRDLKDIVIQDSDCALEDEVDRVQIAKWFFGL
jgi:uncharacterized protein YcgI (DUF1989 family)